MKLYFLFALFLFFGADLFAKERSADKVHLGEELLQSDVPRPGHIKQPQIQNIYSHFMNALMLEKRGQLDQALREYNRTLELDPSATLIYRQRANLYLRMGNTGKALSDAQAYVRSYPDDTDALLLLSNIHILLNQNVAAKIILEKIIENHPDHEESIMTLATLIMNEEPLEAIKLLEKYVALQSQSVDGYYYLGLLYQKIGNPKKSKEMFEKVIESESDSLPSLILLGQMSEVEGDTKTAVKYYEIALKKMPENLSLRMQLVLLYAQKMEMDPIERLLEGYKNNPSAPVEAVLWLGIVYETKKEWKEAMEYYLLAQKQMDGAELYLRLANIYSHLDEPGKALRSLKTVVKRNPDNSQFRYFLGLAYLDIKKPRKAEKEFRKALELRKDFSSAYFQLGVALDNMGQWGEAEKMFLYAIQMDTQNAAACNYLGYTYADRNENLFEARRLIERALEIEQDNAAYLDSLGWLNYRENNFKAALMHLKNAAEQMPDSTIYDHLGDCYRSMSNPSGAAVSYEKSLELDSGNREVRKKLAELNKTMVPTSPARKLLKEFDDRFNGVSNISGLILFRPKTGVAGLLSSASSSPLPRAFFYLRKSGTVNISSASLNTELRIDLLNPLLLPSVILRYRNYPQVEWRVFPPEFKGQLPGETEIVLGQMASLLNGQFFYDFDNMKTVIEEKGGAFLFRNGERSICVEKKRGVVSQIIVGNQLLKIEKYQKVGGLWLPLKVDFRWRDPKGDGRRRLQVEFLHISLDPIENKIFEIGKEK